MSAKEEKNEERKEASDRRDVGTKQAKEERKKDMKPKKGGNQGWKRRKVRK